MKQMLDLANLRYSFPAYKVETLPEIPEGFLDMSWRNDMCPSFVNEALNLTIWVDFENPDDREDPELERFMLCKSEDDGDGPVIIISTNDYNAILEALKKVTA